LPTTTPGFTWITNTANPNGVKLKNPSGGLIPRSRRKLSMMMLGEDAISVIGAHLARLELIEVHHQQHQQPSSSSGSSSGGNNSKKACCWNRTVEAASPHHSSRFHFINETRMKTELGL
jgi:hypothetical protein